MSRSNNTAGAVQLPTPATPDLRVGDVVFTRIGAYPFRQVSLATGSWTNHVGIVVDVRDGQAMVGESRFPLCGTTTLERFVARSEGRRVALARLRTPLTAQQEIQLRQAAARRAGIPYDTGFDVYSRRQFCSRYVRELLQEAAGTSIGQIQSFHDLLSAQPDVKLGFWRTWYFGSIPWKRQTVTPASLMASPELELIFDGTLPRPKSRERASGWAPRALEQTWGRWTTRALQA